MISLCLTNHNRDDLLYRAFEQVLDHPKISEIVISDDCSDEKYWKNIQFDHPKVKIYRNNTNVGMSRNKMISVSLAQNEWCILFDSDNIIDGNYVDCLDDLNAETIYMPEFAKPKFDFRHLAGKQINQDNVKSFAGVPIFDVLLNTCNYVVNKEKYLEVYEFNPEVKGSDTIWFNYLWLKSGYSFKVVPGMQYYHTVHNGSGFLEHASYNFKMAEKTKQLIWAL